jgi:hypothetical protein
VTHDPGEPLSTNTDIFEKAIGTARLWLGQWSGTLKALRLPQGLLDLKLLTSTPANPPAGWARLNVLNNIVKMVNSSGTDLLAATIAAAAGGGDITHHAYPWFMRRDFANHTPGGAGFFDRESLLHYPGWTLGEQDATSQNGNSSSQNTNGEELDGLSPSRRTTFYKITDLVTEEAWNPLYDLRIAIPQGFTTWGANGIILRHKIDVAAGVGNVNDTGVVRIDVYDPSTGSETSAANASRTRTGADAADTAYQDIQITGATLNALSPAFAAGNMLHLRIDLSGAFSFGASPDFWLGRLSAYFE